MAVTARSSLYIGLMSGTSMDGVDGVLVDLPASGAAPLRVLASHHAPMPPALAAELLALNATGPDELHRAALAANALAHLQGQVVAALLAASGCAAGAVRAIGSHGQTVRHRPGAFDGIGYTLQLNNPALLAELTGIDVISDFRARDVAAGGQGAPLVPAFHAAVFGAGAVHGPRAILNVGGIANLTLLPPAAEDDVNAGIEVLGFDCGPGNALMDGWCREHLGTDYDDGGRWAASGHVHAGLLTQCLAEPFFRQPPPKSTGRDLFNRGWLDAQLATIGATGARALAPVDVQTTLLALTARSAIEALRRAAPATSELLVCGGGAFNLALLQALAAAWPGLDVTTTGRAGLPPMLVESAAFAWLARAFTTREPGNRPTVTGARGARILGALYPA